MRAITTKPMKYMLIKERYVILGRVHWHPTLCLEVQRVFRVMDDSVGVIPESKVLPQKSSVFIIKHSSGVYVGCVPSQG